MIECCVAMLYAGGVNEGNSIFIETATRERHRVIGDLECYVYIIATIVNPI